MRRSREILGDFDEYHSMLEETVYLEEPTNDLTVSRSLKPSVRKKSLVSQQGSFEESEEEEFDEIDEPKPDRSLQNWNRMQKKWKNIESKLSKKLGKSASDLIMNRSCEEYRKKIEEVEILESSIPPYLRFSEIIWQSSLRNHSEHFADITMVKVGATNWPFPLYCPVRNNMTQKDVETIRPTATYIERKSPLSMKNTLGIRNFESEYVRKNYKKYIKKRISHDPQTKMEGLIVVGSRIDPPQDWNMSEVSEEEEDIASTIYPPESMGGLSTQVLPDLSITDEEFPVMEEDFEETEDELEEEIAQKDHPSIHITPTNLTFFVPPNEVCTKIIKIRNDGNEDLKFQWYKTLSKPKANVETDNRESTSTPPSESSETEASETSEKPGEIEIETKTESEVNNSGISRIFDGSAKGLESSELQKSRAGTKFQITDTHNGVLRVREELDFRISFSSSYTGIFSDLFMLRTDPGTTEESGLLVVRAVVQDVIDEKIPEERSGMEKKFQEFRKVQKSLRLEKIAQASARMEEEERMKEKEKLMRRRDKDDDQIIEFVGIGGEVVSKTQGEIIEEQLKKFRLMNEDEETFKILHLDKDALKFMKQLWERVCKELNVEEEWEYSMSQIHSRINEIPSSKRRFHFLSVFGIVRSLLCSEKCLEEMRTFKSKVLYQLGYDSWTDGIENLSDCIEQTKIGAKKVGGGSARKKKSGRGKKDKFVVDGETINMEETKEQWDERIEIVKKDQSYAIIRNAVTQMVAKWEVFNSLFQ